MNHDASRFKKILNPQLSQALTRKVLEVAIFQNGGTNATISREGHTRRV